MSVKHECLMLEAACLHVAAYPLHPKDLSFGGVPVLESLMSTYSMIIHYERRQDDGFRWQ